MAFKVQNDAPKYLLQLGDNSILIFLQIYYSIVIDVDPLLESNSPKMVFKF